MSYLRYLCLFAHSGVQHIFCFVFLRPVYPMLSVSLDCPFSIVSLVFSNVYQQYLQDPPYLSLTFEDDDCEMKHYSLAIY
jgi:hypothetical protein